MIVDLCKPINPGESDTVRIVLSRPEAETLRAELGELPYDGDSYTSRLHKALMDALYGRVKR